MNEVINSDTVGSSSSFICFYLYIRRGCTYWQCLSSANIQCPPYSKLVNGLLLLSSTIFLLSICASGYDELYERINTALSGHLHQVQFNSEDGGQDLIRISASQVLSSRMFVVAKDNKEASNHIPFSTSTKGMQSFLVGYYTIFFFKPFLAAPLNDMMVHKDFNWDTASWEIDYRGHSFLGIYNCMGLRFHDPSLPKLGGRPDAAEKIGVGALLLQVRPPIT